MIVNPSGPFSYEIVIFYLIIKWRLSYIPFKTDAFFEVDVFILFTFFFFIMSKIVKIKVLKMALKLRSMLKYLTDLIFDNDGDRQNWQRILVYTGFPFETKSEECEEKFIKLKMTF